MGASGKLEAGGSVTVEFAVDVDFGGVGFGSDSDLAVAVGRSRWDGG